MIPTVGNGLKRPETAVKRCFNALNFTVFYRNPSSRITGRFFRQKPAIVFRRISIHFWDDGLRRRFKAGFHRFLSFFYRLRQFTAPSSSTWEVYLKA
jgi:hypothetical protein